MRKRRDGRRADMREILYRGKEIKTGKWVYGFYYTEADTAFILLHRKSLKTPSMSYSKQFVCVDPETVEEYTGLESADSNRYITVDGERVKDLRIFEGDIVKWKILSGKIIKGTVEYANSGFYVVPRWIAVHTAFSVCEIIGNIHDTPELLGRERD
jgi:hypothetical protein